MQITNLGSVFNSKCFWEDLRHWITDFGSEIYSSLLVRSLRDIAVTFLSQSQISKEENTYGPTFVSGLKRVFVQEHSYQNVFHLQGTHFHMIMTGFVWGLVKKWQTVTRIWLTFTRINPLHKVKFEWQYLYILRLKFMWKSLCLET